MDIVEADKYRVRGNWLFFSKLPLDPIQIPFDLGVDRYIDPVKGDRARPPLRLKYHDREIVRLDVEAYGSWRPVLPAFSRDVVGTVEGSVSIRVETAIRDWQ
jgi:hypothetical protein